MLENTSVPSFKNVQRVINELVHDHSVSKDLIFEGMRSTEIKSLSALDALKLSDNLRVDTEMLYCGQVHIKQIAAQLCEQDSLIAPEHYLKGAFSSTTSLNSLLSHAKTVGRREDILKKLQIHESYLSEHRPLSVLATRNALEIISNLISEESIASIGALNASKFCNGEFGQKLLTYSDSDRVEAFLENIKLVERNWTYKLIKKTSTSCIIETAENELLTDTIGFNKFSTSALNKWRCRFLKEVLSYNTQFNIECFEGEEMDKKGKTTFNVVFH